MMRNRLLVRGFALLATLSAGAACCGGARGSRLQPGHPMESQTSGDLFVQHDHATPAARALAGKDHADRRGGGGVRSVGEHAAQSRSLRSHKGQPSAGYAPRAEGGVLSYNEFWYERGNRLTKDKRTSLIVDPPNGRIPFTEAARRRNAEMPSDSDSGFGDSYEDRSLADRCLWASTPARRWRPAPTTTTCKSCRLRDRS